MLKTGILFLYGTFTHLIVIVMWNEYIWYKQMFNGGVGGSPISNINPFYWRIIVIEFIISALLILLGAIINFRKGEFK